MDLEAVLNHRRAVKIFDPEKPLDSSKVKHSLELATLAPSSSNMQLWEFYHITYKQVITAIKKPCSEKLSVCTASQVVAFVYQE